MPSALQALPAASQKLLGIIDSLGLVFMDLTALGASEQGRGGLTSSSFLEPGWELWNHGMGRDLGAHPWNGDAFPMP